MTTVHAIIEAQIATAAATFEPERIDEAVDSVIAAAQGAGARPIGGSWLDYRAEYRAEILRAQAHRLYADERMARSFIAGFNAFRDAIGNDLDLPRDMDKNAWERGRAANPDYKTHVKARARALREMEVRFGEATATQKAHAFFCKRYARAFTDISQRGDCVS